MDKSYIEKRITDISTELNDDLSIAEPLFKAAKAIFKPEEVERIEFAFKCANDSHRGQMRKSGEPYIIHPLAVALIILTEFHLYDVDSVISGLLHDVIEDTAVTKSAIISLFNSDVAKLVDGVTKIKNLNHVSKDKESQINDCKMLKTCADDIRVIMIKIADRLHNMRTMIYQGSKDQIEDYKSFTQKGGSIEDFGIIPTPKQISKSAETYALFVPLAERIGAMKIRNELLDLSFMYLQNTDYHNIRYALSTYKAKKTPTLTANIVELGDLLTQSQIPHSISLRYKSLFDIYHYLQDNSKNNLREIPDLVTYEIEVENSDNCYKALTQVISRYHIVKIDDYIKKTRSNGYKAIHIVLDNGMVLRIFSRRMRLINECGIAAFTTLYQKNMPEIQSMLNKSNSFVHSLKSIGQLSQNNATFLKSVQKDLLSNQIEVISKDKERISLPCGATVLDFAYHIHSYIGDSAVSAIVNDKIVTLDTVLLEGDNIIINTDPTQNHQPREYANLVVTYNAKKKIKEGYNRAQRLTRKLEKPSS